MSTTQVSLLLVEDNEDDYLIVRELLEDISSMDVHLEWVSTFEEGYAAIMQRHHDVCLLDYNLGGHTGLEFLQLLPADHPAPIILLTGNEDHRVDVAVAEAGAADYLVKGHTNAPVLERAIRYAIQRKASETAVTQAYRFAQATVDALPENIAVLDAEGVIVAVNSAWRNFAETSRFIGWECGVGRNYLVACEFGGTVDGLEATRLIREAMLHEGKSSLEYSCLCNGEQRWFEMCVTRFTGGGPLYAVVAHEDITIRKLAEFQLRDNSARFRALVENSWDGIALFDSYGGILFGSESTTRVLGYELDEFIGRSAFELIHEEDHEYVQLKLAAAVRQPRSGVVVTARVQHKNGEWLCLEGVFTNLLDDPNVGAIVNNYRDITERNNAEHQRDRFFTLSLDMLCIAGHDGYFKRVNPAFSEVLGYTQAELLSQPYLDLVHPDDRPDTQGVAASTAFGHSVSSFENRYRTKAGSYRWLEWKSVTGIDEGLIYAAARDVTEHKESVEALRSMRDELEVRVGERTAELEKTNAALQFEMTERIGAEDEARIRARQQEAVAEFGRQALTDVDMQTLLDGATALVSSTLEVEVGAVMEELPHDDGLRIAATTGWRRDLKGMGVPGGRGSLSGFALLSDTPTIVTDLANETRFVPPPLLLERGIVSGLTVVVQGYERPYGTLSALTIAKRDFTLNDIHFLQAMSNVLTAVIERHRVEMHIRDLNIQLNETNQQLRQDNVERQVALAALNEVTLILQLAKEEAEQARENAEIANLAKSEFLSRMSHELRTPLNAILGFGQILEMRNADADRQQQANIQQILKAGRHLLDLINEVLDIASIEAGHLSLSTEPVEMGSIVRQVMDMVQPLAAAREITIADGMTCDGTSHPRVLADQQRLKQVLLNFLSNAVKYNNSGGSVVIGCQAIAGEAATFDGVACAGRLRILVQDTGPGLTPDEMTRLFMPFERLEASKTKIEGSGIGLSLCKKLVEAMQGEVGVESEFGKGSTFWMELPLLANSTSPTDAEDGQQAAELVAPIFDTPHTILYIEDNLSNVNLVERVLANLSDQIKLFPAMQGSLGLDMATLHHPDLILLDLHLPDMMGSAVLARLKDNPETRDIPVIVLSADATAHQIERLMNAGAKHYLTKPLDVRELYAVLQENLTEAPINAPAITSDHEQKPLPERPISHH